MLGNKRKWNPDHCHNMNAQGIGIKKQVALLWSADPYGDYGDSHELVGSVLAHMGHLERYGAVYWTMKSKADLEKYPDTIAGYIYCSDTKSVNYRVRIKELTYDPNKKDLVYIPMWRNRTPSGDFLYILIDQIDTMFPQRDLDDFEKLDGTPIERPPIGGFVRVRDPIF